MHNGLLKMGNAKMAGSVGNVVNVVDLLKKYHPETVRFLLLGTHYRSPIEYSDDRLAEVRRSLGGFYRFFERYQRVVGAGFHQIEAPARQGEIPADGDLIKEIDALRKRFLECMDDDFNTGGAVGVLYEMLNKLNRYADDKKLEDPAAKPQAKADFTEGVRVLKEMSQILGIFQSPAIAEKGGDDQLVGGLMQLLIDLRAEARKAKNFALGDQIRKRLTDLGVTLEDRPGGTGWRVG
jgi:cysteinyl-tRNA synthetase